MGELVVKGEEVMEVKGPVVVTGASGFVGSWLVMKLLQAGYTVRATVRDPGELSVSSPRHCRTDTTRTCDATRRVIVAGTQNFDCLVVSANVGKTRPLLDLPGAKERLSIWKADLSEEGSFDDAIKGCTGVFHVATPMDFDSQDPEVQTKSSIGLQQIPDPD